MLSDVPPPLAAVFLKQVTVTAAELCELLPMGAKTLQAHVRHGHIEYVDFGTTDGPSKRVFTLEHVLRFINSRSFREVPYPLRPNRQAIVPFEPINENSYTFRLAMQREAAEAEKRQEYRAAVARYGRLSKRLPPSVGLDQSPVAFAARKRLREEAKAQKTEIKAAAAARTAKKENRPPPGENSEAWKRHLAEQRRRRVAERQSRRRGPQGDAV